MNASSNRAKSQRFVPQAPPLFNEIRQICSENLQNENIISNDEYQFFASLFRLLTYPNLLKVKIRDGRYANVPPAFALYALCLGKGVKFFLQRERFDLDADDELDQHGRYEQCLLEPWSYLLNQSGESAQGHCTVSQDGTVLQVENIQQKMQLRKGGRWSRYWYLYLSPKRSVALSRPRLAWQLLMETGCELTMESHPDEPLFAVEATTAQLDAVQRTPFDLQEWLSVEQATECEQACYIPSSELWQAVHTKNNKLLSSGSRASRTSRASRESELEEILETELDHYHVAERSDYKNEILENMLVIIQELREYEKRENESVILHQLAQMCDREKMYLLNSRRYFSSQENVAERSAVSEHPFSSDPDREDETPGGSSLLSRRPYFFNLFKGARDPKRTKQNTIRDERASRAIDMSRGVRESLKQSK